MSCDPATQDHYNPLPYSARAVALCDDLTQVVREAAKSSDPTLSDQGCRVEFFLKDLAEKMGGKFNVCDALVYALRFGVWP